MGLMGFRIGYGAMWVVRWIGVCLMPQAVGSGALCPAFDLKVAREKLQALLSLRKLLASSGVHGMHIVSRIPHAWSVLGYAECKLNRIRALPSILKPHAGPQTSDLYRECRTHDVGVRYTGY